MVKISLNTIFRERGSHSNWLRLCVASALGNLDFVINFRDRMILNIVLSVSTSFFRVVADPPIPVVILLLQRLGK